MKTFPLFVGTFVSASLLFFGLGVASLMVLPVFASFTVDKTVHFPVLTPSQLRDTRDQFWDLTSNANKQPYPALALSEQLDPNLSRIVIPSIGVDVPIALSPSIEDADVISTLEKGAALYPNGISPGHLGNLFIAAHSTGEPWKGAYRFAFLRINELEAGNIMHVDYNGARYTYTVTDKEIIIPTNGYEVVSDRPVPTLSLMACWPLWSTQKRMLVHAELTNVTKLTQKPA